LAPQCVSINKFILMNKKFSNSKILENKKTGLIYSI
jgi:hypothetical protein